MLANNQKPKIPTNTKKKNAPTSLKINTEEEEKINKIQNDKKVQKKPQTSAGNPKRPFKKSTNNTVKSARGRPDLDTVSNKSGLTNNTEMNNKRTVTKQETEGMELRLAKLKLQKKMPQLEQELAEIRKKIAKENQEKANLQKYIDKYEQDNERKAQNIFEPPYNPNALKNKNTTAMKKNESKNSNILKNPNEEKNFTLNNTCKKYSSNENNNDDESENAYPKKIKISIKMGGAPKVSMIDDENGEKCLIKTKIDLMKFIYKIYCDNINLKNFQTQAENLSKNNEEISSILGESIDGFENVAKNSGNQAVIQAVEKRMGEIKENMEKSLEEKLKNFNEENEKKEGELKFIQQAFDKVEKEYKEKQNDEMQQKIIVKGLNDQIKFLEMKLVRFQKKQQEAEKEKEDKNKK